MRPYTYKLLAPVWRKNFVKNKSYMRVARRLAWITGHGVSFVMQELQLDFVVVEDSLLLGQMQTALLTFMTYTVPNNSLGHAVIIYV